MKITDFAPYIAKIKASGADSVITGNWGKDFSLMLKAAADAGLQVNWYTYYAGGTGGPTAVKQTGLNHRVFQISEGIANIPHAASQEFEKALRAKYDFGLFYPRGVNQLRMLFAAMEETKSADPKKIAAALEGMKFEVFNGGEGFMRKDDHQFFQPMYISSFGERGASEPFDEEKTGWGWKIDRQGRRQGHDDADHLQDEPAQLTYVAERRRERRGLFRTVGAASVLELIIISTLNGVLFGMLLFLMASGLTLIFSMMGVLNFAHASFYMLGAFFGFQISRWVGFWPALIVAPILVGAIGAAGRALRPAQRAPARPRAGAAVHLRPRLRDRGGRADDLGQARRSISAYRRRSTSPPSRSSRPTIRPTRCSCC